MIELFVNELSLDGQFHDSSTFRTSVAEFTKLVDAAQVVVRGVGGRIWRSDSLRHALVGPNRSLVSVLNGMADREAREALVDVVFNVNAPASWEAERLHSSVDKYEHHNVVVTDTSVAELAERQLARSINGGLLNFRPSRYSPPPVSIIKNDVGAISLGNSFDAKDDFSQWSSSFTKPQYAVTSVHPPEDLETSLVDRLRYDLTSRHVQGRRVYRHRTSNNLLYVDNFHFGAASHIEVFDRFGHHLGEAGLDGTLKPNTRDASKTLDVS